jgi:hypothetical protein
VATAPRLSAQIKQRSWKTKKIFDRRLQNLKIQDDVQNHFEQNFQKDKLPMYAHKFKTTQTYNSEYLSSKYND